MLTACLGAKSTVLSRTAPTGPARVLAQLRHCLEISGTVLDKAALNGPVRLTGHLASRGGPPIGLAPLSSGYILEHAALSTLDTLSLQNILSWSGFY